MILIARIKQIVDGLLQYIQYDYESVPEHETFLYHMFYGTRDGSFDFYEQAKKLFLRTNTSPRKIQVKMEYPKDKSHLPCIIVREPGRSTDKPAPRRRPAQRGRRMRGYGRHAGSAAAR